jgi:hypothetical protein
MPLHVGVAMRIRRIVCAIGVTVAACPAVLAVTASPAGACSCTAIGDEEAFSLADVVFTGTVVAAEAPADATAPTTLRFDVDQVYKGDVAAHQEVRTPSSSAACGLAPTDERLLVFAAEPGATRSASLDATDGQLVAFLCGGTRDLTTTAVPRAFGAGRAPAAADGSGSRSGGDVDTGVVAGLAAVLLHAVIAGLITTRRRPGHSTSGGGANP